MKRLEMLRAQLDRNHVATVAQWKRRMRKAVFTSSVLFMCVVAFSAMHYGWGSERAGVVALGLIGLCLLQTRELLNEEHEWTQPLASTRLQGTFDLLLTKAPGTEVFQALGRPLYMADHIALREHVDAWHAAGEPAGGQQGGVPSFRSNMALPGADR